MIDYLNQFVFPFLFSLAFIIVYLFRRKIPKSITRRYPGLSKSFGLKFIGYNKTIILPVVLASFLLFLFALVSNITHLNIGYTVEMDALTFFSSFVLNPIGEEFAVRGFMLGVFFVWFPKLFSKKIGEKNLYLITISGLVLTSVFFALQHDNPNVYSYLQRFFSGLLYGGLYLYNKGNLLPSMVAHSWNNILVCIIASL